MASASLQLPLSFVDFTPELNTRGFFYINSVNMGNIFLCVLTFVEIV